MKVGHTHVIFRNSQRYNMSMRCCTVINGKIAGRLVVIEHPIKHAATEMLALKECSGCFK